MARRTGVDIDIDTDGLRGLSVLKPRDAKRVVAKGLTDTARTGRTKAARHIGRQYSIKSTVARRQISYRRARRDDLQAQIRAFGRQLDLIESAKSIRQTKRGVSAHAFGERRLFRGTFLATMSSGHRGIFKRADASSGGRVGRLPIRELRGLSVPKALASDSVYVPLQEELVADASKKVQRQLDRELRKQAGKNR